MRISKEQLQKIVAEEVQTHFKKSLMNETRRKIRTVKATPKMLRRIIAEEIDRAGSNVDHLYPGNNFSPETIDLIKKREEAFGPEYGQPGGRRNDNSQDNKALKHYGAYSGDLSRPIYIMDKNFLSGKDGGKMEVYKSSSQREIQKSITLSSTNPQHELAMYYLEKYDISKPENLKGFVEVANGIVATDVLSTDFYVWHGRNSQPLVGYKREDKK